MVKSLHNKYQSGFATNDKESRISEDQKIIAIFLILFSFLCITIFFFLQIPDKDKLQFMY